MCQQIWYISVYHSVFAVVDVTIAGLSFFVHIITPLSSHLSLTERGKSNFPSFLFLSHHRHLTAHNCATVLLLFSVSGFFGTGSIFVVDVVWRTFAVRLFSMWMMIMAFSLSLLFGHGMFGEETQKQNKSPVLGECELMLVITEECCHCGTVRQREEVCLKLVDSLWARVLSIMVRQMLVLK